MTLDERKELCIVRDSAMGALSDHAKYPQLRLPEMQKRRLERIFEMVNNMIDRKDIDLRRREGAR